MPRPDPMAGLFSPEWRAYDAVARALPDCAHNRAWRALGPGRGDTPDCAHNLEHRAAVASAWSVFLAALSGVPGPGALAEQGALW